MQTMVRTATEARLLHDFPPVVSAEEANELPRQNLMLIVTGSQGERRAASAQLARGSYLGFSLKEGDTFLFSSMTIPGNERDVLRIVNALSEQGVDIADNTQGQFHVSGHANRPDLERMHDLVRPEMLIPMHGEHRHLRQHALLAQRRGMASAIAPNGTMLDLTGPEPVVAGHVDTGRLYLDGTAIYGAMDGVVRERIKMALNDAKVNPDDIHYVNAHGTSTAVNDRVESLAIKQAFGEQAYKTPVSSTKSMMGHLIAAAGSAEAIVCLLSIRNGMLPPTINYETPDPDCDLDYIPNAPREAKVDRALSNSFGFGGQNISLILSRFNG